MKSFLLIILLAVFLETVADIFFKTWSTNNRHLLLACGIFFYTIGTFIWAYSLRLEYLSKAISIFSVLNLIAVILIGVLFFKEDLSMQNKAGVALGIVSVILMQW